MYHQHSAKNIMIYITKGIDLTNPFMIFAGEGANGDLVATLSICLYNILLNIKYDSCIVRDRRSLNSVLSKP